VSHWPFDYQFGFTKQALVGKIFRMLLCALMAINSLAVTSFLVMQDNITVRSPKSIPIYGGRCVIVLNIGTKTSARIPDTRTVF
jgi:hypothetical protein